MDSCRANAVVDVVNVVSLVVVNNLVVNIVDIVIVDIVDKAVVIIDVTVIVVGGLQKVDFIKNKSGKVVSKKANANSNQTYNRVKR